MERKKILLGITGSIAAYKSLEVIRLFKKRGIDCICCLTDNARHFVTPLSVRTLSNNDIIENMFSDREKPLVHIDLQKVDLVLIAPATFNIIGKIASGIADDTLSTIISATEAPVLIVPCMNTKMWENPILQANIKKLKSLGYHFVEPDQGELATLQIGKGRFPTPEKIVEIAEKILTSSNYLIGRSTSNTGRKVLVTAGRTEEDIDPVRFISNRSSGRMGYALADVLRKTGADVTLISGPTELTPPYGVNLIKVRTAKQMEKEVLKLAKKFDILIMTSAVSDFTPVSYSKQKLKRDKSLELKLKPTNDILKQVRKKAPKLFIVGFSLETENIIKNAEKKLKDKDLDVIVANDISSMGAEDCKLTLIDKKGKKEKLPLLSKYESAQRVIEFVSHRM